ncbi:hypothetical protein [Streptomyces sp. NPDC052114]|uniref:hypothetical protein n=1 Tax=unclassified Streptomyces TaxID=2593676 RepID=UPI0034182E79
MWVPFPFSSHFVQASYSPFVFTQHLTALDDLRAFVGENLAAEDGEDQCSAKEAKKRSKAAVAALRGVTAREFVLVCSHVWACAAFEVPSGRSAEAGAAFYNRWVGGMNTDPTAPYVLMAAEKPTVIAVR